MNETDSWFERASLREFNATSLFVSFLTGQAFAYFRYRLRIAFLLDVVRFIIHVVEFLVISATFGEVAAAMVILLRAGSMILNGTWWGVLEIMRDRLRSLTQAKNKTMIELEIAQWLAFSFAVSIIVVVIGWASCYILFNSDGSEILFYGFLIILELCIRIPMQTFHSGMFATKRIYRPAWSLVLPIAVQLLIISLGSIFYPGVAAILALIIATAVSIWVTTVYILRAYRFIGIRPQLEWELFRFSRLFSVMPWTQGLETALAGLSLRLDAAIVLAIAGIYSTQDRAFDLTAGAAGWRDIDAIQFLYLTLPLLRGAYDTTGIFYFDLVRLGRKPYLRRIRKWFFNKLLLAIAASATFFWLLAVGLGAIVLTDIPFSFIAAIFPIFILRGLLGSYQIRMFADGEFRKLILTNILFFALLTLVWMDVNPASDLMQIIAAMLVMLVLYVNIQYSWDRNFKYHPLLSLGDWLDRLPLGRDPVYVGRLRIPAWVSAGQRSAAMDLMIAALTDSGHFAFRTENTVLFYLRPVQKIVNSKSSAEEFYLALQSSSGGIICQGEIINSEHRNIVDVLVDKKWIRPVNVTNTSLKFLGIMFKILFPDGISFDLRTQDGFRKMRKLDNSLLREVFPASVRGIQGFSPLISMSKGWVSPIFHHGELRLIFVLPGAADSESFERWVKIVRAWNLRTADNARGIDAL